MATHPWCGPPGYVSPFRSARADTLGTQALAGKNNAQKKEDTIALLESYAKK